MCPYKTKNKNKIREEPKDMTELEKIAYAKSFIDKLANGINPLDDTPIPDGDIVNNVRLSRCFFFVSDILRQVYENDGIVVSKKAKQRKNEFSLTEEERAKIQISDISLSVSEISRYLNTIVDLDKTKRLSAAEINNWLLSMGLLENIMLSNGKNRKVPTPQGNEIGIFSEERNGQYGPYVAVLFLPKAQQFIYDNIEAIVEAKFEKQDPLSEFHGRPWTEIHDERLAELFKNNASVSEMAFELKRTEGGIKARLKRLGLIENRSDTI